MRNKKVVLAAILLSAFLLSVQTVCAQMPVVTLRERNVPIKEILNKIEQQTDCYFFWNAADFDASKRVSVNVENAPVTDVIVSILPGFDCRIDKSKIFLVRQQVHQTKSIEVKKPWIISGSVKDGAGEPLVGASVLLNENGSANAVITDINGNFSMELPGSPRSGLSVLVSFIGFSDKTVSIIPSQSNYSIVLQENSLALNEIVVVGYGTQKRASVTGAVSQIQGSELLKAPVGNVSNLLAGRISGVITLQQSGQPGEDAAGILVRGSSAKYIVDGFERGFSEIDPNEIATISVLKDASSASVYGLDAGSVIIITTKRGKTSLSTISFAGAYGISQNAEMLEMLDGPGYAYWYNKATEMDGNTPIFTSQHVKYMREAKNGWGNTDWYRETFRTGYNHNLNLNASGGTEKIKYFVSLGKYSQEGNVRAFNFDRYNLRSNIDAEISSNLDLKFDVAARIQKKYAPLYGAGKDDYNNIPQQAIRTHPYVPKEIGGLPVSTRAASVFVNPIAASDLSGYNNADTKIFQTNIALNYRVPFIQGLSLKAEGSYDVMHTVTKRFSIPYRTYIANTVSPTVGELTYSYGWDVRGEESSLVEGFSNSTNLRGNVSAKYDKKIGHNNISALLLGEAESIDNNSFGAYGYQFEIFELDELDYNSDPTKTKVIGSSRKSRTAGFLGRITYDYNDKYLAEVSLRYDGSYVFGGMVKGKRWSPFPAASVGWRISQEDWFKRNINFVNNMKIRAAVGITGRTAIPPYYYLNTLSYMSTPAVVLGGKPQEGLVTSKPANVNLSWEKTRQYNLGIDATLWNGLLGWEFDIFYKYVYDILVSSSQVPASFGGYTPGYENAGIQDHKGFEITLMHSNYIGDFSYNIGLNVTYAFRRWLRYPDALNTPDWLKLTGKEVGSQIGFIADGLFQSEEEIKNSPIIEAALPSIGDIRYVDRNGDGVISYNQDRGYVGRPSFPRLVVGFNMSANWKGIDFSALLQSGLIRDVAITGVYPTGVMSHTSFTKPFYGNGNSPVFLVENSWTEKNRNAEFPRLSVVTKSGNNAYSSTFWYRNGNYLRLKSVQLGYSLPKNLIRKLNVSVVRFYVEGQNLLTFSKLTKYGMDPEQPDVSNGYYPQQRVYNLGVKLTF